MSRPRRPVCTGIHEVDEMIDKIATAHADTFTATQLDCLRELLADVLMTSPEGIRLLDDLAYTPATESSGTQRRDLVRGASDDGADPASNKEHAG